jgi:hypothetical protein
MGNYGAAAENLESQLVDWYEAYKSGDYAAADFIKQTIVEQGYLSSGEFDNTIIPDSYGQTANSWLEYSSQYSDDAINRSINQDVRDQIAETGQDDYWYGDGSLGTEALDLEKELADAYNSTSDPVLREAILAQQAILLGQGLDPSALQFPPDSTTGLNLAALQRGEVNSWDYDNQSESADRKRWGAQCFLSAQIDKLADYHIQINKSSATSGLDQYRRIHMIGGVKGDEGQARLLVNKLHARKDMSEFVEITPSEMGQLVPKIEISKIVYDDNNKYVDEVRMPFPAHSIFRADSDVLESARSDYGITNVSWAFQGVQPDAVKNDIVSTVTFYFEGFDTLVRNHADVGKGGSDINWSYLDLLGFGRSTVIPEELAKGRIFDDPHYYEIRLKAGYNIANSTFNDIDDPNVRQSLRDAVQAQNTDLYLGLVDHEISVNDTGTIVIRCDFRGRLEQLLGDAKADVLATSEYKTKLEQLAEDVETARTRRVPNDNVVREVQERYNRELDKIRTTRLEAIIQRLERKRQIYNIIATAESLGGFSSGAYTGDIQLPDPSFEAIKNSAGTEYQVRDETLLEYDNEYVTRRRVADPSYEPFSFAGTPDESDIKERLSYVEPQRVNQGGYSIPFFYFGDLVEVLAEIAFEPSNLSASDLNKQLPKSAFEEEQTRNMRIILGPFEYEKVLCGVPKSVNLASVPIAVDAFIEFFYNRVLTSRAKSFPLQSFMRKMADELLIQALGRTCAGQEKSQVVSVNTYTVEAPPVAGRDPIELLLERQRTETGTDSNVLRISYFNPVAENHMDARLLVPNTLIETDVLSQFKYLVMYAQQEVEAALTGDPLVDKANGIHHLYIGSSRGLLKAISFQKTDIAYEREARLQSVSDNPLYQLANRYNITIDMFGNNLFIPGTYVYLNPMGLGAALGDPSTRSSISRAMGLGGYHIVTNVVHQIDRGTYKTTITALHETSGGGRRFCNDID